MAVSIPPMTMYFHGRMSEVILFPGWIPSDLLGLFNFLLFIINNGESSFPMVQKHKTDQLNQLVTKLRIV